jgi:superfamily II DNA or RNA helicase
MAMQEKLLHAYSEKAVGTKTLIFNNGINTSLYVYETFREAGFPIRHLDNTSSSEERKEILTWFKKTPDAVLTSVGILTTGFDEPTVETIILNRATKSLTLYFQMIGRGSRKLPNKSDFTVIDLGNNAARFGLWNEPVDWQHIFKSPEYYLENLRDDVDIELHFKYQMPPELRAKFKNTG